MAQYKSRCRACALIGIDGRTHVDFGYSQHYCATHAGYVVAARVIDGVDLRDPDAAEEFMRAFVDRMDGTEAMYVAFQQALVQLAAQLAADRAKARGA